MSFPSPFFASAARTTPGPDGGGNGSRFDGFAHHAHGVHVDARLGGADVDRGADEVCLAQRLRDALDQRVVAACKALLHERRIAADEVDAQLLSRLVERVGEAHGVLALTGRRHHADGGDGDALVDDGDAVFLFDVLSCFDQVLGAAHDLVIDLDARLFDVLVETVEQRNTHGDGPHVQVFVVDHMDGFQNVFGFQHIQNPFKTV